VNLNQPTKELADISLSTTLNASEL